ncbi:MAG: hypothetical protein V5A87_03950 [Candidatus Bipolaricaulota bacterium]|nr:hypothetical protein [Candidatus Bipolaricaulota bacterium]
MQKTRLAFVSLLSLLVVLAPVSTALAKTRNTEKLVKSEEGLKQIQKDNPKEYEFNKVEELGGKEVSDKTLDQKEGEGPFGALIGAITGAVVGLGASLANGIVNNHGAARMARDVVVTTASCSAAGATVGGLVSGPT